MSLESNDSFLQLAVKEVSSDDPFYPLLQKIVDHLQVTFTNAGAAETGISVLRQGFNDSFVGTYAIQEDGSGKTVGLVKNVEGELIPLSFPLPNEIRLLRGGGTGALVPPKGWEVITDSEIVKRFNIGASPNWTVAAIRYIGV